MNSEEKKKYAFYGMILVVVVLAFYLIYYVRTEAVSCMSSPLVYGVNHLSTEGRNATVTCTCSSGGTMQLFVTKDNLTWYYGTQPLI